MLLPLVLAFGLAASTGDPPVRVSLNHDYFRQGDRAKVYVQADQDGYLVVLRADADGRVRILFPLDPGDDGYIRGDREIQIRGRGDRDAFTIDEGQGTGAVLAAVSRDPFTFAQFVRGDHWDYRVFAQRRVSDDPEAGLLDIVRDMAGDARFDYDIARYTVGSTNYRTYSSYYDPFGMSCFGCGYYPGGYGFGLAVGYGYCDPFWYDPFDPFCYNGFGYYGYGYGRAYYPGYYYPWWGGGYFGGGYYSGRFSDPQAASRRWGEIHRPSGPPFVLKNTSTTGRWTPALNPPPPAPRGRAEALRPAERNRPAPDARPARPPERREQPPARPAERPRSGDKDRPAPPPPRPNPPPQERRGGNEGNRQSPPPRVERPRGNEGGRPAPPPPKQGGDDRKSGDSGGGRRKP